MSYQLNKTGEEIQRDMNEGLDNQPQETIGWDDLRFPLTGRYIDTTLGRIDMNYYTGAVDFANNARYNISEAISFMVQMPHSWKEGSEIRPHIHWFQRDVNENIPNWLLAYRIYSKGEIVTLANDYSLHTLVAIDTHAFTYTSGILDQISSFPAIDMTNKGLSETIHCVLFRDTGNDSGIFDGNDPSSIVESVKEFDIHYQQNQPRGSRQEFIK